MGRDYKLSEQFDYKRNLGACLSILTVAKMDKVSKSAKYSTNQMALLASIYLLFLKGVSPYRRKELEHMFESMDFYLEHQQFSNNHHVLIRDGLVKGTEKNKKRFEITQEGYDVLFYYQYANKFIYNAFKTYKPK